MSNLFDSSEFELAEKKRKIEKNPTQQSRVGTTTQWLQLGRMQVTLDDKDAVIDGGLLNDQIMDFAQTLLLHQFRRIPICGLQSTLFQQSKEISPFPNSKPILHVQVVHCMNRRHWIVVSTINIDGNSIGSSADVFVYDSLYSSVDDDTLCLLKKWFGTNVNIKLPSMQIQIGSADCGLFAIAVLVALLYNVDPAKQKFDQTLMRQHLIPYFERNEFVMFP